MNKTEFNLSEKEWTNKSYTGYLKDDVKEFIRLLKEWIDEEHIHFNGAKGKDCDRECWGKSFPRIIDKLAGKELTK